MRSIDCPAATSRRCIALVRLGVAVAVAAAPTIAGAHDISGPIQYLLTQGAGSDDGPVARVPHAAAPARSRALEMRRWQARVPSSPHVAVARATPSELASRPITVGIYNDKTLRRGDAVMTPQGLRVFNGSRSFPFLPSDFSTLDATPALTKSARDHLAAYDQTPLPQHDDIQMVAMTIHLQTLK